MALVIASVFNRLDHSTRTAPQSSNLHVSTSKKNPQTRDFS